MAKKRSKVKQNRVEFLKELYSPKIKLSDYLSEEIGREFEGVKVTDEKSLFEAFHNADPSDNKKYLLWMLERFIKKPKPRVVDRLGVETTVDLKRLIVEDLDKVAGFLDFFNKFNDKFDIDNRNISDYMCVDDFFDVVYKKMPKEGDFMSASQMERQYKKQIDIWLDSDKWKVVVPRTYEASQAYGKNTLWCTASKTTDYQFNYHNKMGPLIILINKLAAKDDDTTHKLQFHFETNQFMDAKDVSVRDSYLTMFDNDKDLLNAFLKNLKDRHSFLLRLKLNIPIPENCKVIRDQDKKSDGTEFTLDLSDMKASSIPDGLTIEGNLNIANNKNIKTLKDIIVKGDLNISDSSITEIGPNVVVHGSFDAFCCDKLESIADGLIVKGSLDISSCSKLKDLPNKCSINGSLYASHCEQVTSIPKVMKIKYGLYVNYTKYSEMVNSGRIDLPTDMLEIGEHGNEIYCEDDI